MIPAKRVLDVVCAASGLLVFAPVFGVIALTIYFEDRGSIFFRQERIGYLGRPFRIWKFRTMTMGAHLTGPSLTSSRDTRITRAGSWLRKTKLDELPQLINVLLGEMSLVGPRPEVAKYVDMYSAEQRRVLELRPGITDPASLRFFDEGELLGCADDPELFYVRELMPAKIALNVGYAARANLRSDIKVILATVLRGPFGRSFAGRIAPYEVEPSSDGASRDVVAP